MKAVKSLHSVLRRQWLMSTVADLQATAAPTLPKSHVVGRATDT